MNLKLKLKIVEFFLTQSAFSKEIGRSDAYVSRVISGYFIPEQSEMNRWAKFLHTDVEELFPND